MTSSKRRSTRRCSLLRRLLAAAAVSLVAAPVAATTTGTVVEAARERSSSEEVAGAAGRALDALEVWETEGDPAAYVDFLRTRDLTARLAAAELGLDPWTVVAAWSTSHPTKQVAVLGALTQLGVPYRTHTSIEGQGFDCSGLTTYAWARAGVELNRSSGDQVRAAARVDRDSADAGDLVYYPGHVMMYLGVDDAIVHSPNRGNHVEITFVTARRASSVVYADPLG